MRKRYCVEAAPREHQIDRHAAHVGGRGRHGDMCGGKRGGVAKPVAYRQYVISIRGECSQVRNLRFWRAAGAPGVDTRLSGGSLDRPGDIPGDDRRRCWSADAARLLGACRSAGSRES